MSILKKEKNKVMRLSVADSERLIDELFNRMNIPDEYEVEMQRRIAEIKAGTAKGSSVDQVFSAIDLVTIGKLKNFK